MRLEGLNTFKQFYDLIANRTRDLQHSASSNYATEFPRIKCNIWLRAGRLGGQSSSLGSVRNFNFFMWRRLALGPTQLLNKWVLGLFSRG
jgi:hypothetical protein